MWLVPLLTLVLGGLVSAVGTFVATRNKLRSDYDADLREKRITVYVVLWSRLEPLAKYGRDSPLTEPGLVALAGSLRSWYFRTGGLFLSTASRANYFALQEVLVLIVGGWGQQGPDRWELTPAAWHHLRTCASRLRTSLTVDVGTRAQPALPGVAERIDRSAAGTYVNDAGDHLRLAFRPRLLGGAPRMTRTTASARPRTVQVLSWSSSRQEVRVSFDGGADRLLIIEPDLLVESHYLPGTHQDPPLLWRRTNTR